MRPMIGILFAVLNFVNASAAEQITIHEVDSGGVNTSSPIVAFLDNSGNYWVSTEDGLAVNDGTTWHELYEHPAFKHRIIRYIDDGKDGKVWFGTGYELVELDTRTDRFEAYSYKDGTLPVERHQAVLADQAGNVLLAADADLYRLNLATNAFEKNISFGDSSTPIAIPSLIDSKIVVGIFGKGIYSGSLVPDFSPLLLAEDGEAKSAYSVTPCSGYYGVPHKKGFAVYDQEFKQVANFLSKHAVSASCDQSSGDIYFGGIDIVKWNRSSKSFTEFGKIHDQHDEPWLIVNVMQDKGIWASSYTGKTYFGSFKPVASYHVIPDVKRVNAVAMSNDGLIVATNDGLQLFDQQLSTLTKLTQGKEAYTLGRYSEGIWSGGGSELVLYRGRDQITKLANPDGVGTPASSVFKINNTIMASFPSYGVYRYVDNSWQPFIPIEKQNESGFPSYVWILFAESADVLHIQTHGRGVYRIQHSTGSSERITTDISVLKYQPARAVTFTDSDVFVSTEGGLVYRYMPKTMQYELVDGTPRASRCVARNSTGHLYVSANHGILYETPSKAMYLQDGHFGIPPGSITGDSCTKLASDAFAITTRNGVVTLSPENAVAIHDDQFEVTFLEINGVKRFTNDQVQVEGPVRSARIWLSSRNPVAANVGMKFVQINDGEPETIAPANSYIDLFDLDYGTNSIRILSDLGNEGSNRVLTIHVSSPWYLNTGVQVAGALFIFGLVVALIAHFYLLLREKAKRQSLQETHTFLVHELRSPLSNLIAQTEQSESESAARDVAMLRYMRNLVDESLDRLRLEQGLTIYFDQRKEKGLTEYSTLEGAATLALASVEQLAASYKVDVQYEISDEVKSLLAPTSVLERIIFNATSNAIKASPNCGVWMRIAMANESISISVKDSGRIANTGNAKWLGSGFGTKVMDKLCQSIGASYSFTENENGHVFEIDVPLTFFRKVNSTILLVDDDDGFRQKLSESLLKGFSCDIHHAASTDEAIQKIAEVPNITLVIADWRLGHETADALIQRCTASGKETILLHGGFAVPSNRNLIQIDKMIGVEKIIQKVAGTFPLRSRAIS